MTEPEYQALLEQANQLLIAIGEFPADELNAFAEAHHPDDIPFTLLTLKVWVAYLEASG